MDSNFNTDESGIEHKVLSNKTKSPVRKSQIVDKLDTYKIHDDIRNLLWIGNGIYRNYVRQAPVESGEVSLFESFVSEPSVINTRLAVASVVNRDDVEIPYSPHYEELSKEQRRVYLDFLANPYDPNIGIGYVYLLFYGLERHLLIGNFEDAFKVILKLIPVHKHKSFQESAKRSLLISCLYHKKFNQAKEYFSSLVNEERKKMTVSLFFYCLYLFDEPILPKDIIEKASAFGFSNTNYIKKYPDLFEEVMKNELTNTYGKAYIHIKELTIENRICSIPKINLYLTNISLRKKVIPIPNILGDSLFVERIFGLIQSSHNFIKKDFAEKRKLGIKPEMIIPTKINNNTKKIPTFDIATEQELLHELDCAKTDPIRRYNAND